MPYELTIEDKRVVYTNNLAAATRAHFDLETKISVLEEVLKDEDPAEVAAALAPMRVQLGQVAAQMAKFDIMLDALRPQFIDAALDGVTPGPTAANGNGARPRRPVAKR